MTKISILIPTFNRGEMLKKAIKSALSQDYENLEVIVSDNHSNDNTSEIVSEFLEDKRFKYYRNEENIGLVNNFKKLVFDYMDGDYFILLGDDDYLIKENYISQVVNIIENNNNILMVCSNWYICIEDINKKREIKLPFNEIEDGKTVFMSYLKTEGTSMSNSVFNREFTIKSTNIFNNEYNLSFDSVLVFKSCLCGNVGIIKEFSSVDTFHSKNLSTNLQDYRYVINAVNHVIEPYNWAVKHDKLSNDEMDEWENRVILNIFLFTIARTLYFFPEKIKDTLSYLSNENYNISQKLLDNKTYKVMIFLHKLHLFRFFYKSRQILKLRWF